MPTILVIDDQEPIRSLLRRALEGADYEVLEASNGRLGLELYRERSADLIITDIFMPGMNGLEMMVELTRNFLEVKVIAMSGGLESEGALNVAKVLGASSNVSKTLRHRKITQCRSIRIGTSLARMISICQHRPKVGYFRSREKLNGTPF